MTNLTIGADPEILLSYEGHTLVSAIDCIGGTKQNPRPMGDGFFVQEDNVAAEYNIPAAITAGEFSHNIKHGALLVKGLAEVRGLTLSTKASGVYGKEQLKDPRAMEFGCEPDYNAWTFLENEKPIPENEAFRSAGGHVHVGNFDAPDVLVVRAMDLFLGVPSVMLDTDTERRKLYGQAGSYRPKPYGIEYRVLSNFWIFQEKYTRWVWNATHKAVAFAEKLTELNPESDIGKWIQDCINNSDKELYKKIKDIWPTIEPEF